MIVTSVMSFKITYLFWRLLYYYLYNTWATSNGTNLLSRRVMQPQLLCVITVKCVFLVWDSVKAHLLLLLLRTKQKEKKWQLEEQFLSIKGYWEFNYLSCEVFQGCGQLIRVIMHRVRGHVHRAQGGGCCCSLRKKKSQLKLVSRYQHSHALCS